MDFEISLEERRVLLAMARESIASKLEGRAPAYPGLGSGAGDGGAVAGSAGTAAGDAAAAGAGNGGAAGNSALKKPCGAFVTLYKAAAAGASGAARHGAAVSGRAGESGAAASGAGKKVLRGCIGRLAASLPLEETVRAMARAAAFGDPRFPPLAKEELPHCRIEISALSPMRRCDDPAQIKVGVHGLHLIAGGRSGVLLPQVPVEQGWSLREYLDYISAKAGLPAGSHELPGAELRVFTAVVFGEERSGA